MVKHTETIRQLLADKLFEYVWSFCQRHIIDIYMEEEFFKYEAL